MRLEEHFESSSTVQRNERTEYSAAVYTGTNNDPAHMKKGHLDEKEEQRIPKEL